MTDLRAIVHSDPQIHSGTPVFVGTRVPARTLLDYLEGGDTLEEFLDNYPGLLSSIYIAHVRHRTTGSTPTHADTHPFSRELAGRELHEGSSAGARREFAHVLSGYVTDAADASP